MNPPPPVVVDPSVTGNIVAAKVVNIAYVVEGIDNEAFAVPSVIHNHVVSVPPASYSTSVIHVIDPPPRFPRLVCFLGCIVFLFCLPFLSVDTIWKRLLMLLGFLLFFSLCYFLNYTYPRN